MDGRPTGLSPFPDGVRPGLRAAGGSSPTPPCPSDARRVSPLYDAVFCVRDGVQGVELPGLLASALPTGKQLRTVLKQLFPVAWLWRRTYQKLIVEKALRPQVPNLHIPWPKVDGDATPGYFSAGLAVEEFLKRLRAMEQINEYKVKHGDTL